MKTVTCYTKSLYTAAQPLNIFVLYVLFSMMLTPSFSQCTLTKESCSITYPTITYTSAISGSEWDGERICLQDDLIVDEDFTITTTEVYLSTGISIYVESPNTLTIINSELFADDEMWESIHVEAGATLEMSGSIVAHAEIAVFASNSIFGIESFLALYDNHFCNNEIGIYIGPYSSAIGLTSLILKNEFSAPSLIEPLAGEIGDYGIFVDKVYTTAPGPALTIGSLSPFTGSSTYNYFHDINIGVRLLESKVTIQNNLFEDFTAGTAADLPNVFPINENHGFRNTAIVASSNPFNLRALVVGTAVISGYNNEIRNSVFGIQTDNYVKPTIIANNIRGNVSGSTYTMHTGISIKNYSDQILISDNRIERFHTFGIRQIDASQTTSAIADNFISTLDGFTASLSPTAIAVSQSILGTNLDQTIENNTISEIRNGVLISNVVSPVVSGNVVNYESTSASSTSYGIRLQNCVWASVQSNTVTGDCTSGGCGYNVRNITLEGCEESLVDQNYTRYGSAGIWFQGISIYSNFTCNEIRDSFKGVMWNNLGSGGQPIGPSIQSASGGPSDNAWFPETTQNRLHIQAITDASSVKWKYRDDFDYFDVFYPSLYTEGGTPLPDEPAFELVTGETCDMPLRTTDEETDAITALLNKYGHWMEAYLSDAEFFNPVSYAYAWRFWDEVKDNEELIALFTDSLENVYDKILTTNIPELQNVYTLIDAFSYEEAYALNTTIVPDNATEENLQTVNAIYCSSIDSVGNLMLSNENTATLETIAQLNELENGKAIYLAQGMLQKWFDVHVELTEEKKYIPGANDYVLFYPNPASDYLYFTAPELISEIAIYNFTGEQVWHTLIPDSGYLILNKLYTGLYFIKMKLKNGTERSEVISIISNN